MKTDIFYTLCCDALASGLSSGSISAEEGKRLAQDILYFVQARGESILLEDIWNFLKERSSLKGRLHGYLSTLQQADDAVTLQK